MMSALSTKLRLAEGNLLHFFCPGCQEIHGINVGGGGWTWNGDVNFPTFTPSVLVTNGHYTSNYKPGDECWCTYNAEHGDDRPHYQCIRCHSYVTGGQIQFLSDSTHPLSGQTVPLPEWTNHEE